MYDFEEEPLREIREGLHGLEAVGPCGLRRRPDQYTLMAHRSYSTNFSRQP